MDKAELKAAQRPATQQLQNDYVLAWQAHHKALYNEFMTRHLLE